jgi:three-Cys-motif partner protein
VSKKQNSSKPPSLFPELDDISRAPRRDRKKLGIPAGLDLDTYERDEDGRLREIVGSWVRKKHSVLDTYVGYTRGVRKSWVARGLGGGTSYIDLFSGPGQVRIQDTKDVLPGSPLVAWMSSGWGPFTDVYIADAHDEIVRDCDARLSSVGAPAQHFTGEADKTVDEVLRKLNRRSYHFAFLDPYNLSNLSFEVIRKLARLQRMDILAHVSVQDLNRNLRLYIEEHGSSLDRFAPGWRKKVNINQPDEVVRAEIMEYWKGLLKTINMRLAEALPLVTGDGGQPLYWLAFASRHPKAHEFWAAMQPTSPPTQDTLFQHLD